MAIEHSKAAKALQEYFKSFEPRLIECPELDDPIYAHPLSGAQLDKLDAAYGGRDENGVERSARMYDVRLMMLALHYENGDKVFDETDAHMLLQSDPALIQRISLQITAHVVTSFQTVKNS